MYVIKNEKIRILDTIIANIFTWFLYIFAVQFLVLGFEAVKTLDNQTNFLLGIMIICMADIKILSWAGRPAIYFDTVENE